MNRGQSSLARALALQPLRFRVTALLLGGAAVLASCAPSGPPEVPDAENTAAAADAESAGEVNDGSAAGRGSGAAPSASTEPAPERADAAGQAALDDPEAQSQASRREVDLDAKDGLDADLEALDRQTKSGSEKTDNESSSRDIVYRVTPKGLVIELDGLHLRPEAKASKDKGGAYAIELTLNAESFDGRQYWVKLPKEGPLSLAGSIEDKSGKKTRFADDRQGDGEQVVMAEQPHRFRQRWPGRGQPKLWWGQTVTLEVGLWGVRAESERERPVRRLFVVKMVGGNSPQPVITPPTLDWGS